jgi:quercetin dioxygenase-like cupin family protein
MIKRNPIPDQLDAAVDAVLADRTAGPAPTAANLAELVRLAADLRDLPQAAFKARLAGELAHGIGRRAPAASNVGPVLLTGDDIGARLAEIAKGPTFEPYDLQSGLSGLPELTMRFFAALDQCTIGVSRFSGDTHWERHPAGDELLHVLEGDMEVTTLTDDGPVQSQVPAGSVFVCPRGLWHRLRPLSPVSLFYATPGEGIEHSPADRPPRPRRAVRRRRGAPQGPSATTLVAYDIQAALSSTPPLTITSTTTAAEADAAFRYLTTFNRCSVNVGHFSGRSPWERHRGGDELLHILDGEVDITVLSEGGPIHQTIGAGCVFVCPRGLWHRQHSTHGVTALYATPTPSDISFADDPRREA